jgi:pyruvate/2-oxoglutarate dehydrogenase complex dihydrolipoamide dehydrogenase (E3) component
MGQYGAAQYDAIIIGTGQAGPPLARLLADKGWKVAIAEGGTFGGTCVNTGCTPSKAMIGSANAIQMARRGGDFGFAAGEVRADFGQIVARRDEIVTKSREGLVKSLEKRSNITLYHQYASFEAAKRVRVGDEVIEGKQIFINTGARAVIPPIEGLESVPYLDNVSLMALKELPSHLMILGGGYVGIEMAQAFRRFGSEVTVLDRAAMPLEHEDKEFSKGIRKLLESEGITFVMDARVSKVAQDNGQISVQYRGKDGAKQTLDGSHLLVAVGRRPNSDKLGVEKAGLELDDKGYIQVDDKLRTNVEGVYALGDVNGRGAFTHTSYNDYQVAAANLMGGDRSIRDRVMMYGVYTDPQLARVGMNEAQARESGRKALVATMPMEKVNRAKEFGQTTGLMKVLVDAESEQFLGATFFGLTADEAIHGIVDLMHAKMPYTVIRDAVHIHPTVSELIPTLLEGLEPLK